MDLKGFYLDNIKTDEYYYKFHHSINNVNDVPNEFTVHDAEEGITKFRELCQPENEVFDLNTKCWFYLVSYYLYKVGYVIEEFPRLLAQPPVEPRDFTGRDIKNRIIEKGDNTNEKVEWTSRRLFVASLTFKQNSISIDIPDSINQKFIEISTRQASFDNMSTDEKLAEIANLIENLLKKDGKFVTPDYPTICFDYISDDVVKAYRTKLHCFRHATDGAISERKSYSEEQKNFFVDYGLTIVNVIHSLLN